MTRPQSTDLRLETTIAAWLESGPAELSDHVIEVARGEIHRTPQRHARRFLSRLHMTTQLRLFAAVGIAAVVLALVAVGLLIKPAPSVGPPPSPSPSPNWTPTGSMTSARGEHTATVLPNGGVLVAGGFGADGEATASSELYDPATGSWTLTGTMTVARGYHTATLLPNGKVLVTGGFGNTNGGIQSASAELYDPGSGVWTATGAMTEARAYQSATLLPDGKVLVVGGLGGADGIARLASTELYDPATGSWALTGNTVAGRWFHTATLLLDGTVLVAGGNGPGDTALASVEVYDATSGTWANAQNMIEGRQEATATLLDDGRVLVAGGASGGVEVDSAELYNPVDGSWTTTGNMVAPFVGLASAVLLNDGTVLVTGGTGTIEHLIGLAQLYDPMTMSWSATQPMILGRSAHTTTLLPDGRVLVAGGGIGGSSELFDPAASGPLR